MLGFHMELYYVDHSNCSIQITFFCSVVVVFEKSIPNSFQNYYLSEACK